MEDQLNKEIQEAIQAANHALACLRQADAYLQSAKNWGLFDMLGGGALTTFLNIRKWTMPVMKWKGPKERCRAFVKNWWMSINAFI